MVKKKKISPSKYPRNAVKTRARILARATQLFAEMGYEGTSLRDIVAATRTNKRMIYHYFGDKRGLYRAIFVHEWTCLKNWFDQAMSEALEETGERPIATRDLLRLAISIYNDFMVEHQYFMRLMMWEGLEGGEISRSIWTEIRGPLFAQVEFLLKRAQAEAILSNALDVTHLIISLLGANSFYFAYASSISDMINEDPLGPHALKQRKEQMILFLENILRTENIEP